MFKQNYLDLGFVNAVNSLHFGGIAAIFPCYLVLKLIVLISSVGIIFIVSI